MTIISRVEVILYVPKFTLSKNEKLKSKKSIDLLFEVGKHISIFPLRQVYILQDLPKGQRESLFAVSVPKKSFKRAVDRNRIKRLIREAYRLNCLPLKEKLLADNKQLMVMYIYFGKEMPIYEDIEKTMIKIIERSLKKI